MKTLVTAIQKGGQGKTFVTCHLAFDFSERNLRIIVLDLDTQGNASFTLSAFKSEITASQLFSGVAEKLSEYFRDRSNLGITLISADFGLADMDKIPLGQATAALRSSINAIAPHFDICLVDTAPALGVAMSAAVLAADYMLSPIEMEAYSLQGMEKMVTVVSHLRQANPKLVYLGMLPNKIDARKPRHIANLKALKSAYPKLVLPCSIGSRDSIAEALGEKIPVWKIKKTAARRASQEVRSLAEYVYKSINRS